MERRRVRMEFDERRAAILAAARRLLGERPISDISMTEFADAAGVARGLLHHYFGSKRELYLAVVRDVVRVPVLPVPEDAHELSVEEIWEASVDGWLHLIEADPEHWLAAVSAGAAGRDPEVEAILDESKEVIAERALQALGLGDAPPDELRAIVRCYGALTEEVTREWLQRKRITRAQARVVLLRSLPLLVAQVLPEVQDQRKR